ncbi:unnamed protein product [Calypogeia fissa]
MGETAKCDRTGENGARYEGNTGSAANIGDWSAATIARSHVLTERPLAGAQKEHRGAEGSIGNLQIRGGPGQWGGEERPKQPSRRAPAQERGATGQLQAAIPVIGGDCGSKKSRVHTIDQHRPREGVIGVCGQQSRGPRTSTEQPGAEARYVQQRPFRWIADCAGYVMMMQKAECASQ